MLYWINNKTFRPQLTLSLKPNNFAELCIGDDKQGRGSNVVWYFGVGQGKGGPAVMLLRNEQLDYWWGMGYNGNQAVMKNAEALDAFGISRKPTCRILSRAIRPSARRCGLPWKSLRRREVQRWRKRERVAKSSCEYIACSTVSAYQMSRNHATHTGNWHLPLLGPRSHKQPPLLSHSPRILHWALHSSMTTALLLTSGLLLLILL